MKMRQILSMLMAICLLLLLAACSEETQESGNTVAAKQSTRSVDVDLTALSSTMIYAEVYNMLSQPEDYVGKTVKMSGNFAIYQATDSSGNPVNDNIYFACVVADATACCSQGIEFVLKGDPAYPDDYPELGTAITVTGEFRTYMEGEYQYIHLVDATMEQ